LQSVTEKGEYIRKKISEFGSKYVGEIRGKGLMIGVDMINGAKAVEVEKKVLEKGLLTSTAGANTLRLVPPLNITYKEIDEGLAILREVLLEKAN
jgi:acetylornithine/N-succinyldiaminopimelate aminotransferase